MLLVCAFVCSCLHVHVYMHTYMCVLMCFASVWCAYISLAFTCSLLHGCVYTHSTQTCMCLHSHVCVQRCLCVLVQVCAHDPARHDTMLQWRLQSSLSRLPHSLTTIESASHIVPKSGGEQLCGASVLVWANGGIYLKICHPYSLQYGFLKQKLFPTPQMPVKQPAPPLWSPHTSWPWNLPRTAAASGAP